MKVAEHIGKTWEFLGSQDEDREAWMSAHVVVSEAVERLGISAFVERSRSAMLAVDDFMLVEGMCKKS